jgi:hypothetical protein
VFSVVLTEYSSYCILKSSKRKAKRKEQKVMYKILEENVMFRLEDKWVKVNIVLTTVSGGKRIDYVTGDGTILKSEAYSRSKYNKAV